MAALWRPNDRGANNHRGFTAEPTLAHPQSARRHRSVYGLRPDVDVCCAVDVMGSMQSVASSEDQDSASLACSQAQEPMDQACAICAAS